MAYTVKQVAAMSSVSVRTLHFYDETGVLKPAYHKANGYRYYEEPQLLALQQILFYRELGFELKQIRQILDRDDFENLDALQSHRDILQKNLARTRTLIETIDKTIKHLKGATPGNETRRNWMSRTQLAFNSGDLVFQEIITSRPYHHSATRVVSLNAVWPVTFPST
jgi:DNA-binding transcriptional MerR regulator